MLYGMEMDAVHRDTANWIDKDKIARRSHVASAFCRHRKDG